MAIAAQVWIDATRRKLQANMGDQLNVLTNNYTPGDTSITITHDFGNINTGSYLSIGLNIFYVWSISGTNVVTVTGGQNGSTDVACTAGSFIRVNPHFSDWDIWQELTNDLADLSSGRYGLFGIQSSDFNYDPVLTGYDLGTIAAADLMSIYEVKHLTPGPEKDMPRIPSNGYRLTRNAVTSDISSGLGLQIFNKYGLTSGYKIRVVWKSIFIMPASPSGDITLSGLQPTAYDLPPLGAAIKLMAGREIPRNFTDAQGDVRRATEVPAGAIAASPSGLKQERQSRINAESGRLLQMYPLTKD